MSAKTKYQTAESIYRRSAVTVGDFRGIPSIAARHTSIEYLKYDETIQLDAGHIPRELGFKKLLVLITHFHSDHGSDMSNCIHNNLIDNQRITIFVPAYCAKKVFKKIKLDISLQKGRKYTDDEIARIVRIIGCKKHSDNNDIKSIMSKKIEGIVIAEMINMGDKILVKLRNNDEVMIEPFECYHTVDTCGYVIHDVKKRISDIVKIEPNTYFDVNFTEDQRVDSIDIDSFIDINRFSHKHNVKINIEMIKTPKTRNFILNTRRLIFPEGLSITPRDEDDITFFRKYKIEYLTNHLTPKVMFFGDTCSYVFNYQSPGYARICELLDTVENVIIESTYIDSKNRMNDVKFKKRQDKRHIFLFELVKLFKKYRRTQFILIHFSACYTRDNIIKNIDATKNQIKNYNIKAFI